MRVKAAVVGFVAVIAFGLQAGITGGHTGACSVTNLGTCAELLIVGAGVTRISEAAVCIFVALAALESGAIASLAKTDADTVAKFLTVAPETVVEAGRGVRIEAVVVRLVAMLAFLIRTGISGAGAESAPALLWAGAKQPIVRAGSPVGHLDVNAPAPPFAHAVMTL